MPGSQAGAARTGQQVQAKAPLQLCKIKSRDNTAKDPNFYIALEATSTGCVPVTQAGQAPAGTSCCPALVANAQALRGRCDQEWVDGPAVGVEEQAC